MIDTWILRINSAGHTHCPGDWFWDTRRHPSLDFDLWMVTHGSGRLFAPDAEYSLSPGDCFILRPGVGYHGALDPVQLLSVMHIHFDVLGEDGGRVYAPVHESLSFHRKLKSPTFIQELAGRAISSWTLSPERRQTAIPWLRTALMEIRFQDQRRTDVGRASLEAINFACGLIDPNPGQQRVSELARLVNLSPDHFTRLFKKVKGCTVNQYIQRMRRTHACSLLLNSNLTVSRIAEQLSFHDPQHFCHTFKSWEGMSPAAFRRKQSG